MRLARTAFIIVAVPYTLVLLLWLFTAAIYPDRSGDSSEGWIFVLCGGGYLYGSLFALRDDMPLSPLVTLGIFLNLVGAIIWVPAFGYPSGSILGFTGIALLAVWLRAIYCVYLLVRG